MSFPESITNDVCDFIDLKRSTEMFGRLAKSNAMAQILYGLALRSVRIPKPRAKDEHFGWDVW